MRLARLLRNAAIGIGAVVAIPAALIGGWWLHAAEPWYDWDVIRQLRSGEHNLPWRDETPRVAALFPQGMEADAARSALKSNGFACASAAAASGRDFQMNCTRETRDSLFCVGRYTVDLVIDGSHHVAGQSGASYVVCL